MKQFLTILLLTASVLAFAIETMHTIKNKEALTKEAQKSININEILNLNPDAIVQGQSLTVEGKLNSPGKRSMVAGKAAEIMVFVDGKKVATVSVPKSSKPGIKAFIKTVKLEKNKRSKKSVITLKNLNAHLFIEYISFTY